MPTFLVIGSPSSLLSRFFQDVTDSIEGKPSVADRIASDWFRLVHQSVGSCTLQYPYSGCRTVGMRQIFMVHWVRIRNYRLLRLKRRCDLGYSARHSYLTPERQSLYFAGLTNKQFDVKDGYFPHGRCTREVQVSYRDFIASVAEFEEGIPRWSNPPRVTIIGRLM